MRVLFFASFFEFQGNETNLTDEVNSVVKRYPNVEFIVYTVNREQNRVTRYKKNILWIERKNLKNIIVIKLFFKDMITIFTKFKPDIIHSPYVIESIIIGVIGKLFRVPSILHGRGTDVNYLPFKHLKAFIIAKTGFFLNNKIITVSKEMKKDVLRLNVPEKKVISIYDGINFSEFSPKKPKEYLKENVFEIIHAGRFSPEKCQDLIIEVCKKLKEDNFKFHMTFIGYGPLENDLRHLIKKYNLESTVKMAGFIDHNKVFQYLEESDLYIQPSLTEGMPKSVLEAMSMELPVVITRVGGMTELINKSGVIMIEKNNKKQLYDAIIHFIENPQIAKNGGKSNRKFILRNFNWEKHAEKLYNLYRSLVNEI